MPYYELSRQRLSPSQHRIDVCNSCKHQTVMQRYAFIVDDGYLCAFCSHCPNCCALAAINCVKPIIFEIDEI